MAPKPKPKRGARAPRSSFRRKTTRRAPSQDAATTPPARRRAATMPPITATSRGTPLGEITVPSGTLAILDIGLVGYLARPALEPAIVKASVPRDRPLAVVGVPVGRGRYAECWDHVAIVLDDAEAASSRKLGAAGVDFARLVCMDHAALDHWIHDDSLDGRADFVFWGRDEAQLAKAMRAPRQAEGYGWLDLTVAEAEARADEAARRKADQRWLLATDLRRHSHHHLALAAARRDRHGAGTLELAGTRLLLFFTSWGDGVFPVYLDFDHDDRPIQVRIQLATADSNAAMALVNP